MAVRILVVDDETRGVELLMRAMRPLGDVVGSTDGEEAWRLFEERAFDLVVSDQRMPGLTGVELLGRVADRDELVGRILLTGFSDLESTVDAINRGRVHAYLSKPCPPAHLVATARSVLERAQLARENHKLVNELLGKNRDLETALASLREAKDAADAANRAKGEFLANISHELRTPMTAILGYSELLMEELPPSEREEAIRAVRSNGAHLLRLVNDVLDLSRSETGKLALQYEEVVLDDLLADLVTTITPRARARGLELVLSRDPKAVAQLATDRGRLRQILINLLDNAMRFTDAGSVRLDVRPARLAGALAVEFAVQDTGIGMSAEDQLRIFRPFTQLNASSTRRVGGAGLGLAIVRRLTDLLGGTVALSSAPGSGTTFRITLRCGGEADVVEPAAPAPEPAAPLDSLRGRRVLLAEDSIDSQRLIAAFLRRAAAQVEVAATGVAAIGSAMAALEAGEPFDVVLMDMQMPELDGYEATRSLRQQGYALPIVALTAHAMVGHREECLAAGCDDYLTKPVDRGQLLAIVERHAAKWAPRAKS